MTTGTTTRSDFNSKRDILGRHAAVQPGIVGYRPSAGCG